MASNRSSNATGVTCLQESEIYLAPILKVLVPIVVITGVVGNIMILIVLNSSKSMKTRSHLLLSAMAAADLAHSLVAFFVNLHVYEDSIDSDTFSRLYHHGLKTPSTVVASWTSMTSTWLAVTVTVERLIAIRYPLKARFVMRKRFIVAAIVIIAVVSFIVTSYYLFWLRQIVYISCQNPSRKLYRLYADQSLFYYGHVSRNLHSILCSLVPVTLLFLFNGSLVYHLHQNQALMRKFYSDEPHSPRTQMEMAEWSSNMNGNANNSNSGSYMDSNYQHGQSSAAPKRREYKVALVVLVISLTSAFCLLPSAALVAYDLVRLFKKNTTTPWWYYTALDITNLLEHLGKVLDFFLYCLTSKKFRQCLLMVITSRCRSNIDANNDQANICLVKQDLQQQDLRQASMSTLSTLSTFLSSATFHLRRSTTSSEWPQKSPHSKYAASISSRSINRWSGGALRQT